MDETRVHNASKAASKTRHVAMPIKRCRSIEIPLSTIEIQAERGINKSTYLLATREIVPIGKPNGFVFDNHIQNHYCRASMCRIGIPRSLVNRAMKYIDLDTQISLHTMKEALKK
eukprot:396889_1